jgi:uncharacterized protein
MPQPSATARFFVLTFVFTYGLQLPGALARLGLGAGYDALYLPLALLGVFGPLVAATYLTWRERGRTGVRALYAWLLQLRGVHWGLLGLLVPGLLLSGVLWLLRAAGREGDWYFLPGVPQLVAAVVIAVAEETGWRGYALPRLIARYGAFYGSALLGVLWALWHVPMFVAQAVPLSLAPVMLLYFVGGSLFFTFLFRKSQGSLLVAVLAHLGAHLNNSHATLPADALPVVVHSIVYAALGFACMRRAAFERSPGTRLVRVGPGLASR